MAQLSDLIVPIESMTDEELLERLRQVRHNRTVVRPARAKIIEKAEKKTVRKVVGKVKVEALSAEEKAKLIEQLKRELEA